MVIKLQVTKAIPICCQQKRNSDSFQLKVGKFSNNCDNLP